MTYDENISKSDVAQLSGEKCRIVRGCGYLEFNGDIKISGRFSGNIVVNGHLFVEKDGMVSGSIISDYLHLRGACSGKATVKIKGVFHDNSRFAGILITNDTEFAEGGVFNGDQFPYQSFQVQGTETKDSKKKLAKNDDNSSDDKDSFSKLFDQNP